VANRFGLLSIVLAVVATAAVARAQSVTIPREHHVWARFSPGAWSKVQKVSQQFDERGELSSTSTTETKTTLLSVDDTGCQLRQEVTVTLGAKRFTPQPQLTRVGFFGETDGEQATVKKLHTTELDAGGIAVMCDILEAKIISDDKQVISTIWHSDSVPPYILRRDTKLTDRQGELVHEETSVKVVALDMPCRVLSEIRTGAYLNTVRTYAKGSTTTVEVICTDVPGGVVSRSYSEMDASGQIVRRSSLELIGYGATAAAPPATYRRPLLLRHKRTRRGVSLEAPME
jgi:hypothetical protein